MAIGRVITSALDGAPMTLLGDVDAATTAGDPKCVY